MQTDLWYDLKLMDLAGRSPVEERIRDAEAAQFPADESEDTEPGADESADDEPGPDEPGA